MPRIYNKLENPALQFGLLWRVRREYCERVKGVKGYKQDALTEVAGNREYGFQSRRQKREVSSMTETIDGTGLKKSRKTATRPRKETCKLATSLEIYWAGLDPEEKKRRQDEQRRRIRAGKRNRRSRYGRREAIILTTNPTRGRRGGLDATVNTRS